ncbi:MAG TPA: exopolysaccharide biosynthesis polyprenyl glycosylphosphotransferase, partial [Solirubrobacterales bacterium]
MSPTERSTGVAAPPPIPAEAPPAPAASPRTARLSPALTWLFEGEGFLYVTLTVDALLLLAALVLADAVNPNPPYAGALLVSPLAVVLLAAFRMYDPHAQIPRLDRLARIVGATAAAAIAVAGVIQLIRPPTTDSDLIAIQLVFATALLVAWRIGWSTLRLHARRSRVSGRLALIVGAGEVGSRLERHLRDLSNLGLIPIGFVDSDPVSEDESGRRGAPVLGSPAEFDAIVTETGARHAIFAFQIEPDVTLRRLVRRCRDRELTMAVVPRLFDDATNRMVLEHVGGIPLFELRQVDPQGWQFALKHGLDRVLAAFMLVLAAPLLAAVAVAVRVSSPGPVLFRQRRVGRDGREFDLLKFRSMRAAPDGDRLPALNGEMAPGGVEGDDRRTRVGRFIRAWSLDELPQLVNVVRGEMSLVGPRPERPELAGDFAERVRRYGERHRVRSGITGWSQVHGLGPGTSLADRAEWDNWYIQNW